MSAGLEPDCRLRMAGLSIWLISVSAAVASISTGLEMVVAGAALVGAVVAGLIFTDTWLSLGVTLLAALVLTTWLLFAGGDPVNILMVAACVLLTGAAAVVSRTRFRPAAIGLEDRASTPSAADTRLPPGVADETVFDRLTLHEMTRARRYERPLTLLLVGIEGWQTITAQRGRRTASELLATLSVKVRRLLRDVDAIGVNGDGRLAVLLPETPLDGALVVAGRIEKLAIDNTGVKVRVGAAVFPDDAVTVESLMREADAALDLARLECVDVVERTRLR
jgi:diguanylate cyclase (GGDEF)-like protein